MDDLRKIYKGIKDKNQLKSLVEKRESLIEELNDLDSRIEPLIEEKLVEIFEKELNEDVAALASSLKVGVSAITQNFPSVKDVENNVALAKMLYSIIVSTDNPSKPLQILEPKLKAYLQANKVDVEKVKENAIANMKRKEDLKKAAKNLDNEFDRSLTSTDRKVLARSERS